MVFPIVRHPELVEGSAPVAFFCSGGRRYKLHRRPAVDGYLSELILRQAQGDGRVKLPHHFCV